MSLSRRQFLATAVPMASFKMPFSVNAMVSASVEGREGPPSACIVEWSSVSGTPPIFIGSGPLSHFHPEGPIEHFRLASLVDLLVLREANTKNDALRRALDLATCRHVVVAALFDWTSALEIWNELEQYPVSLALERSGTWPFLSPPRRCGQVDPAGLRSLGFTSRSSSDELARAYGMNAMRSFPGPIQVQPTRLTVEFSALAVPIVNFSTQTTRIT